MVKKEDRKKVCVEIELARQKINEAFKFIESEGNKLHKLGIDTSYIVTMRNDKQQISSKCTVAIKNHLYNIFMDEMPTLKVEILEA